MPRTKQGVGGDQGVVRSASAGNGRVSARRSPESTGKADRAERPAKSARHGDRPARASSKAKAKKVPAGGLQRERLDRKTYERELARLHVELVKLQEWIRHKGLKIVVLFEGRDAAGKGGVIKRITESLNPRICRVVALPAPPVLRTPKGLEHVGPRAFGYDLEFKSVFS